MTMESCPELLLLVDTETTGLDPATDALCELGAVLFSVPHRAVISQLSFLLPVLSNDAIAINGIEPQLSQLPQPSSEALALFLAMASQADAFLAHNAAFDRPWIEPLLPAELRGAARPWICTCEGIRWPGLKPNPSLQSLALANGIPVWAAHRALTDCTYLAQVLERDPELEAHLKEGLQPRHLVAAQLPYEQRELARQAGFRWIAEAKQWHRRCSESEINALSFPTIAIDPSADRHEPSQPLPC
jgi:DNA polymerase III subunit epsilon